MSRTIRWGILGTGKIARIVARALIDVTPNELVAVASRTADRSRAFAAEFGVPRHHDGYQALIDDSDVDLLYVAADHHQHREWAVAAAEAGKHVLCEKPIGVNAGDATAIVEAARRAGVFLMEAFAYRCHPQTNRLVELLRSGVVGEIRLIDAVFGYDAGPTPGNYLLDHARAGGSILDVGCYATSMAHLVARVVGGGESVDAVEVNGVADLGASTGVDHTAAATMLFPGGLVARVASSVQADLESSLRIYGSRGRIAVPSPWLPGRIGSRSTIVLERKGSEVEEIHTQADEDVYTIEAASVGEFVQDGHVSSGAMPWEESLANMRTLDRWRQSIGLSYEADRTRVDGRHAAGG